MCETFQQRYFCDYYCPDIQTDTIILQRPPSFTMYLEAYKWEGWTSALLLHSARLEKAVLENGSKPRLPGKVGLASSCSGVRTYCVLWGWLTAPSPLEWVALAVCLCSQHACRDCGAAGESGAWALLCWLFSRASKYQQKGREGSWRHQQPHSKIHIKLYKNPRLCLCKNQD